jgi:hypothetical protein
MNASLWQRPAWLLPFSILMIGATAALLAAPGPSMSQQPVAVPVASPTALLPVAGPGLGEWPAPSATATYASGDQQPPTF